MISLKFYVIIKGSTEKMCCPTFFERNFDMKRIIALLLCLGMLAFAASGCGGSQKSTTATGDEARSLNASDYENNLGGLCNYLSALGYINANSKNEGVTYSRMRGTIIGASLDSADSDYSGKRFTAKKTGDTVIELYEFDLNKLNDTAKSVIDSVKNDGTFENAMGETVEDVYLSENGKFLMIYSDKSSDKKNEDHIETKNKVIKAFKEFHAND